MENHPSEQFGSHPQRAEGFGIIPQPSAKFGNVPHASEPVGNVRNIAERKENHTLTVKEVARMFETAGVARTERSIINWCQLNRMGVARLDSYFDPNEHRYFITPESVQSAIQEELAKQKSFSASGSTRESTAAESKEERKESGAPGSSNRLQELERENFDLKFTNRGKDYLIEQLKGERESLAKERDKWIGQLIDSSRRVGELETKLLQLDSPPKSRTEKREGSGALENTSQLSPEA